MIKTYDQFIEEGLFSKKDKSVKLKDFSKPFENAAEECYENIIQYVMANGGSIDVSKAEAPQTLVYAGDKPMRKNGAILVEVTDVKVVEDENSPYSAANGYVLLITLKDGKDFPVDFITVPYESVFDINDMLLTAQS